MFTTIDSVISSYDPDNPLDRTFIPDIQKQEMMRLHNIMDLRFRNAYYEAVKKYPLNVRSFQDMQEILNLINAETRRGMALMDNSDIGGFDPSSDDFVDSDDEPSDDVEEEDRGREWHVIFTHKTIRKYTATIRGMGPALSVTVENFRDLLNNAELVNCDIETMERFSFTETLTVDQELWDKLNECYDNESNLHQDDLMMRIADNC